MEIKQAKLVDGTIINGVAGEYIFDTISTTNDYYEKKLLENYLPFIKEARVILDIGANIGNHSMFWAKKCDTVEIHSFEANPEVFEILKNNKITNGYENVSVYNYAIGSCSGYAKIKSIDESNLGATEFETCEDGEFQIEMIDIDSWVKERNFEYIDFIKIDVEGFEGNVVAGMHETIHKYKPIVWIELWPQNASDILDFLTEESYCCIKIDAMNLLFVAKEKVKECDIIQEKDLLLTMLHYVERTNLYYKNYNTAKKWHENALNKVATLEKQVQKENERIEEITKKLEEEKKIYCETLESEKKHHLKEQEVYRDCISNLKKEIQKNEELLRELETYEIMTKKERSQLEYEANRYRKIRNSIVGKMLAKIYKIFKKIIK